MPQLWAETIAAHQAEVREAILDAAGELLQRRGLLSLSMSEIAAAADIGRATLYKYFPDVEHVLAAWARPRSGCPLGRTGGAGRGPGR